jgi:hypothetical protein
MIRMAARSSKIASVSRNTLSGVGTRSPKTLSTPRAKAMSVATGIAQPSAAGGSPRTQARNTSAGTTMPPTAATAGSTSWSGEESSPSRNSRLISSPTSRKNTAMRPSLIHSRKGLSTENAPTCTATGMAKRPSYAAASGELATTMAPTAAQSSAIPPADSRRRNSRSASRGAISSSVSRTFSGTFSGSKGTSERSAWAGVTKRCRREGGAGRGPVTDRTLRQRERRTAPEYAGRGRGAGRLAPDNGREPCAPDAPPGPGAGAGAAGPEERPHRSGTSGSC